jgi:hypothetical protein
MYRSAFIHLTAVLSLALAGVLLAGCGGQPSDSSSGGGVSNLSVALPEWAPKNASPEFLRAARVIEADPPEFYRREGEADQANRAYWHKMTRWLPTAWELFGTLSDEQMEQFLAGKEIREPVKSLTKKQQAILNRLFEDYRREMKGVPEMEDWLVELYRLGAREDLSNVDVVFPYRASGIAALVFRVQQPGGEPLHSPARLGMVRSDARSG